MSGLELRYGSTKNAACRRRVVSRGRIHCRACAPCMLVYFRQKAGTLNIQFRSCIKKKKKSVNCGTIAWRLHAFSYYALSVRRLFFYPLFS